MGLCGHQAPYAKNPEQMPNAEYIKPTVCVSPQTAFYGEKKFTSVKQKEQDSVRVCYVLSAKFDSGAGGNDYLREIIDLYYL